MAGIIIPIGELSLGILQEILDAMGSIERKIAIGVGNETGYDWEAKNVYFLSGASDVVLPEYVKNNEAALFDAMKTTGTLTGCVGVLAYYLESVDKTLAVMYSVPFDYNLYSNWWDCKMYDGNRQANYNMYSELYYGNPFKGFAGWHSKPIGGGYSVKGYMGNSGTCPMEVRIS